MVYHRILNIVPCPVIVGPCCLSIIYIHIYIHIFIYILAVLGFHCCTGFSLVAGSMGYSLASVRGLLIVAASLVSEHGP